MNFGYLMSLLLLLGITELSYTKFKMTSSCNWNLQFVQLILDFMYCSDNFGSILLWKSCCLLFQFLFIWTSLSLAWMLDASKRTLRRAAAAMRIKKLTYNGNWTQRSRWSVMWWRWCLLFFKMALSFEWWDTLTTFTRQPDGFWFSGRENLGCILKKKWPM